MRVLVLLFSTITVVSAQHVVVKVDASAVKEPMDIGRYGLGQGGLSDAPMFDDQVAAIRSLNVKMIPQSVYQMNAFSFRHIPCISLHLVEIFRALCFF